MKDSVKRFITIGIWTGILSFIVCFIITKPVGVYDVLGCISGAVGPAVILMILYERFLWKINPFEKTPRITGTYTGVIEYVFNGVPGKKNTVVNITQSLLSVSVKITTDEITSSTIVNSLIKENDEDVLYYTYITNPKSKYSRENLIQYGTCRLIIGKDKLQGIYWTSRSGIGDFILQRSRK